ncbi:hypothetical protein DAPPUDRAFT_238621 [Daphnia pulex]|uniref:Uncharacterized protein n=1 Tax=Daphnia pulex TaxID=6669 RepID=E9G6Y2_DAPPU|nr:hypothetical protein DAPPUDRAFT_238621 [Daphnia pulex]|eukprot:EFX84363.1 hypothetical protein DAPPUDRAFT_238621 [Daphnia pulex]
MREAREENRENSSFHVTGWGQRVEEYNNDICQRVENSPDLDGLAESCAKRREKLNTRQGTAPRPESHVTGHFCRTWSTTNNNVHDYTLVSRVTCPTRQTRQETKKFPENPIFIDEKQYDRDVIIMANCALHVIQPFLREGALA